MRYATFCKAWCDKDWSFWAYFDDRASADAFVADYIDIPDCAAAMIPVAAHVDAAAAPNSRFWQRQIARVARHS